MTTPVVDPGLTTAEVAERVAKGQRNDLPPRSGRTAMQIVRANVFTRINAILAVLLVLVLATGSWINGAFGLLIIANSAIGIIQELRAKKTLDSLAVVGEARPRIRRDGVTADHARDEIVLDDLIEIGPGDQIVVDGTVVEADYLDVDESLLTGEADPVDKTPGEPVMSGSFVVAGTGAFRATKVGSDVLRGPTDGRGGQVQPGEVGTDPGHQRHPQGDHLGADPGRHRHHRGAADSGR